MVAQEANAQCWTGLDVRECVDESSLRILERHFSVSEDYLQESYFAYQNDFSLRGVDLNRDGVPEMQMFFMTPNTCSMSVAACAHVIQSTEPSRQILFAGSAHDLIIHYDEVQNGWPIIETRVGGANRCDRFVRHAFGTERYEPISDPVRDCS